VGLQHTPKLLSVVDSIAVEWGTRPLPEDIFDLPEDERLALAEGNRLELPTLVFSIPGGKVRVFPPADFVEQAITDRDTLPLLVALATRQIDYLPWEAVSIDERDGFIRALEPKR